MPPFQNYIAPLNFAPTPPVAYFPTQPQPQPSRTQSAPLPASSQLVPFTGPPDPSTIIFRDPAQANTGPPLHPLTSTALEAKTVYVSNLPPHLNEKQIAEFFLVSFFFFL